MSNWTYIMGVIEVSPMGRTQAEKLYILQTVLDHLPVVQGSEGELNYYINQEKGYDESSSCDEFGEFTNNLKDRYEQKSRNGFFETQNLYLLSIEGHLRDRYFKDTVKDFMPWLTRLAKRIVISDISITIYDYNNRLNITNPEPYYQMNENPSWVSEDNGKPCWCEYLLWDRGKSTYPIGLNAKYGYDNNDVEEFNRRQEYWRNN